MPASQPQRLQRLVANALIIGVALSVAGALVLRQCGVGGVTGPLLIVASTGFVALAVCLGGLHTWYGRLMIAALAF